MAVNEWSVAVVRYGAVILKWTKEELEELDRKTRKVLTKCVHFTLRVILKCFICQEE